MKRTGILNQDILTAVGSLGHADTIVVSDAGLPIPLHVNRIDLSVTKGVVPFFDVLKPMLEEVVVESVILAKEIKKNSPEIHAQILALLGDIPVKYVSQEAFKKLTHDSKAIIRTGQCTPYTNIMLQIGVDFS
ncbi:MAG: D-ribose pyranase [Anaerolineales bacterium]